MKEGDLIVMRWMNRKILETPTRHVVSGAWHAIYIILENTLASKECAVWSLPYLEAIQLGKIKMEIGVN